MKKIVLIMLVVLIVGVVCASSTVMVTNHSTHIVTVVVSSAGNTIDFMLVLPPGGSEAYNGHAGFACTLKAVIGYNMNLTIPGFYEIKHIVLKPGTNNSVDFYFPSLIPGKPIYPGEEK